MESERLKKMLDDLDKKIAGLEQKERETQFVPDFGNLESLVKGYRKFLRERQAVADGLEILKQVRAVLVQSIIQAEQQEKKRATTIKLEEVSEDIKRVNSKVNSAPIGSPEQTRLLLQLSKLREVEANGKNCER